MSRRMALCVFVSLLGLASLPQSPLVLCSHAQVASNPVLKIDGAVSRPLALTVDDLKKMPRKTLTVRNEHDAKSEVYEGVLVQDLLGKAGMPQGESLRGAALASYVVFEADDGYRVVFSIAELDSGIEDSDVMVADTLNGAPIPPKQGPFRLIAPREKRPARWVRMLKSITVVKIPPS